MEPSPDDAAAPSASDEAIDDIVRRLDSSKKALFGLLDPKEALVEIDAALELTERLDEDIRAQLRLVIEANRWFTEGMLELRAEESDLEVAKRHFEAARGKCVALRRLDPDRAGTDGFKVLELGIESKIVEVELAASTDEAEQARLLARRNELGQAMFALGDQSSKDFAESLARYQDALAAFGQSTAALGKLDLVEARRRSAEATAAMARVEELLSRVAENDETLAQMGELLRSFGPLIAAQQAYISVLHDAVVGDVRERHVAMLDEADRQLAEGLAGVSRGAVSMRRLLGRLVEELQVDELARAIETQREIFANLRRLVGEGLTLREVTRRSAPRFAVFFVLSLVVILAGVRLSGIAEQLSGAELIGVVMIALVVAAGSSFGWEAAVRVIDALPFARGRAEEPPQGRTHPV